jgi:hypothetical protein
MTKKPSGDIPSKLLKMFPGKKLPVGADLLIETSHLIENVQDIDTAIDLLDLVHNAGAYLAFFQGGALNRIEVEGWYETDYGSFDKYLTAIGVAKTTANARMWLYNCLLESECSQSDVELLGWTKIRYIAPFLTKQNRAQWIQKVSDTTVADLAEYVEKHESKSANPNSSLKAVIQKAGYHEALNVLGECWPELDITVIEP